MYLDTVYASQDESELPPCPSFLFTSRPALPFSPAITDPAKLKTMSKSNQLPSISATHETPASHLAAERLILALQTGDLTSISDSIVADIWAVLDALTSETDAHALLQKSGLDDIPDALLLDVLTRTVTSSTSYTRGYNCARYLVLPRLGGLNVPPSRDLATALHHIVSLQAPAFFDGCISPLLATTSINKPQAELLVQAIKTCPLNLLLKLITTAYGSLASTAPGSGSSAPLPSASPAWSEHTVSVIQAVVDRKPALQENEVLCLIGGLFHGSSAVGKQVKFSKLILSVIKVYEGQVKGGGAVGRLRSVLGKTDTFMKKSLIAALNKVANA